MPEPCQEFREMDVAIRREAKARLGSSQDIIALDSMVTQVDALMKPATGSAISGDGIILRSLQGSRQSKFRRPWKPRSGNDFKEAKAK